MAILKKMFSITKFNICICDKIYGSTNNTLRANGEHCEQCNNSGETEEVHGLLQTLTAENSSCLGYGSIFFKNKKI